MNKRLRDKRKKALTKYKQQLIIYQLAELKRRYEVLS
tara:strand:- start:60 stop:170 length:111 start_codon:yes stop_codon:yes gene_type:complete